MEQDGVVAERRDGPLLLRKRSVGPMDNNVYVIACAETRASIVVDAANHADLIRDAAAGTRPVAVVQTHGHADHCQAWGDLARDPGWPIWGHAGDVPLFPARPDRLLEHGDVLEVGDLAVEVIHTPGHTDGSLHVLVRGGDRAHLITGDSLFPGGPGNTWGDAARFRTLMDGLAERVFARLDDDTWIYPGHGDDTSVGTERPRLPEWEARGW